MNGLDVQEAQKLMARVRKKAAHWYGTRFSWGCVLSLGNTPEGYNCWHLTTRGGERLMVTNGMISDVAKHYFWLQGKTAVQLGNWELTEDWDGLAQDILMREYHAPMPGGKGQDLGIITIGRLIFGAQRPAVLLCTKRPTCWPP